MRLASALCSMGCAAAVLALPSCRRGPVDQEPWNVLLVTFDTTRADRIGCYGNESIETPALDGLAADGVLFARALSAVPITAPSHSTIHTGLYPLAHGVRDNGLFVLAQDQVTLAEILAEQGYATAAAIGAYPLVARFGLDQGFELYDDHLTGRFENYLGRRVAPKERMFFDERRAAQVNEALLPWLSRHAASDVDRPFFAWVHYFDPHQPFEPAPPYDQLYAADLYDGEIAYADSRLGFLLDHLESLGELDRTLVVMTADHGEGLGEHGELTHAILAYNSTLHVPLIIRPPAGIAPAGAVVDDWVGTVDVVPTILELLGIEYSAALHGRSLVRLWQPDAEPDAKRRRYAENLSPRLSHGWAELRVLFEGGLKYIHGPRPELYDLDVDPHEQNDLLPQRQEDARRLRGILESFIRRNAMAEESSVQPVDDEVRKRLESLGYLHGSASDLTVTERLRDDGVPPSERVGDINDVSSAKHLLFDGRFADALQFTQKLTDAAPENPMYLELHVSALLGLERIDEAWPALERLQRQGAASTSLVVRLTRGAFERGETERAIETLSTHLEEQPSASGWWVLSAFFSSSEEPAQARAALDEALALEPDFSPARIDLAIRRARAGDVQSAEREFLRAIEDSPYYARAHYNYAIFKLGQGRFDEAAVSFRRAIELSPRYLDAYLGLVASLLDLGDLEQAAEVLDSLQRVAPKSDQAAAAVDLVRSAREDA